MKKNLVILISGRGSNMQAILQASTQEGWDAHIAAVISNRPLAQGLTVAQSFGVPTQVIDHQSYASREAFDQALGDAIERYAPLVVVMAGFMRIVTPAFVQRFTGRLINIHPSLLPAFPGLDTHARALEAGCQVAGATVHYVTADLDHGPIIAQAVVPIQSGDTVSSLAERVLCQEHRMLPTAVRWALEGQLRVEDGRVVHALNLKRYWSGFDSDRMK